MQDYYEESKTDYSDLDPCFYGDNKKGRKKRGNVTKSLYMDIPFLVVLVPCFLFVQDVYWCIALLLLSCIIAYIFPLKHRDNYKGILIIANIIFFCVGLVKGAVLRYSDKIVQASFFDYIILVIEILLILILHYRNNESENV